MHQEALPIVGTDYTELASWPAIRPWWKNWAGSLSSWWNGFSARTSPTPSARRP